MDRITHRCAYLYTAWLSHSACHSTTVAPGANFPRSVEFLTSDNWSSCLNIGGIHSINYHRRRRVLNSFWLEKGGSFAPLDPPLDPPLVTIIHTHACYNKYLVQCFQSFHITRPCHPCTHMSDYTEYVAAKLTHLTPLSHTAEHLFVYCTPYHISGWKEFTDVHIWDGAYWRGWYVRGTQSRGWHKKLMLIYFVTIFHLQAFSPPVHV